MTTLSMVAAKLKSKYARLDIDNVFETPSGLKLLTSKAIYGANASGKSNILGAINAFHYIIEQNISNEKAVENIWEQRNKFQPRQAAQEPIVLQYTFTLKDVEYRYGFEILEGNLKSEWLFAKIGNRDIAFFLKEGLNIKVNKKYFGEASPFINSASKQKGTLFRSDSLFLLAIAANGGEISESILKEINTTYILDGLSYDDLLYTVVPFIENSSAFKDSLLSLLSSAEIHIADIDIVEMEEEEFQKLIPETLFKEVKERNIRKPIRLESSRLLQDEPNGEIYKVKGDFRDWESDGTQKFFYIGALVLTALLEGRPFIIDEFDARLHPRLSQKIVDLFNNPQTNPNNAQLIFVTHDVGLLKPYKLRRDQIAFVDKGKDGSSTLTTLAEFKGIRNDASYDKEYMQGAYGGVPVVNQMETVVAKSVKKNERKAD